MKFNSPKQLKDWLRNKELLEGIPSNTLLNYYMMERFLERNSMAYLESSEEYINFN